MLTFECHENKKQHINLPLAAGQQSEIVNIVVYILFDVTRFNYMYFSSTFNQDSI